MRVLILDPFHGAAGDMITAALLDCGADRDLVMHAMGSVVQEPAITLVTRCGIRATRIETGAGHSHRTLDEVLGKCDTAKAPEAALAMARRVFERIAAAEERVHGAKTHFHEVGADDAIADVIGACTALHSLRVEGVTVLPVTTGHGSTTGSHGTYPIPAPATTAILEGSGLAVYPGTNKGELLTPTGAALLAEFAAIGGPDAGPYTVLKTGYGAGTQDPKDTPNVLRAMVVETLQDPIPQDHVDVLETNVDDVSGEVIASVITRCMEDGARDASAIPIMMKKGRPGHLIRIICSRDRSAGLAKILAQELGSLGVRCMPSVHRFIADRTTGEVTVTIAGQMRALPVKYGWLDGRVFTVKPEFDTAWRWALELDVPVRIVLQAATEAGWKAVSEGHARRP